MKLSDRLDALSRGWFEETAKPLADAARELEATVESLREEQGRERGEQMLENFRNAATISKLTQERDEARVIAKKFVESAGRWTFERETVRRWPTEPAGPPQWASEGEKK